MSDNGFIKSLGIPDMDSDGDIDYTDLFLFEEVINDDDE